MVTNYTKQDVETSEQIVHNFLARFLPDHDYEPLLLYAALPLVLTPELLHYLRHRFVPHIPWVAEIDILLAEELCRERGYEQYIMNTPIRIYLLRRAKERHDIYTEDAARLMVQYLHAFARTQPYATLSDMQTQQWSALAFIKDTRAVVAQEIIDAMEIAANQQDGRELRNPELKRLAILAEQLTPELEDYPELLEQAQKVRKILQGHLSISPTSDTVAETNANLASVFISYARNDAVDFAQRLYKDLKAHGVNAWYDDADIIFGEAFITQIDQAIHQSDYFLLVGSPGATESEYCRDEWRKALEYAKPIIPLLLAGEYTDLPKEAYTYFNDVRDFRRTNNYDEQLLHLIELLKVAPGPLGRLYGVPSLPSHYFERPQQISELRNELTAHSTTVLTTSAASVGIRGMGGIGKSVMATALARDYYVRRTFTDGVFWLNLGNEPHLRRLWAQMRSWLDGETLEFTNEIAAADYFSQATSQKECLIILDDVWDSSHVKALEKIGDKSRLLITTRNAQVLNAFKAREYALSMLTETEALELLAHTAELSKNELPPEAEQILRECDNLPLAVSMIGSFLKQKPISAWREVLVALQESDLESVASAFPNYPYPNLSAAFKISLNSFTQEQQTLYQSLSVFEEDSEISEDEILGLWQGLKSGLTPLNARKMLNEFIQASLLRRSESGAFVLHDLLHDMISRELSPETRNQASIILSNYREQKTRESLEKELEEALSIQDAYERSAALVNVAQKMINAGLFEPAQQIFAQIEAVARAIENIESRAKALMNLVRALAQSGLFDRAHSVAVSIENVSGRAAALGTLAQTLAQAGEFSSAIETAQIIQDTGLQALALSSIALAFAKVGDNRSKEIFQQARAVALMIEDTSIRTSALRKIAEAITQSQFIGTPLLGSIMLEDGTFLSWFESGLLQHSTSDGTTIATFIGHTSAVRGALILADNRILSWSDDGTLRIWAIDGTPLIASSGHTGAVNGVIALHDSRLLSWSNDTTLRLWNYSGIEFAVLHGHTAPVRGAMSLADGRILSWSDDATLRLWSRLGEPLSVLNGHTDVVIGAVTLIDGRILSWSRDGTLRLWSIDGLPMTVLKGHAASVNGAYQMNDGRLISWSNDSTIRIWSPDGSPLLRTLHGHTAPVIDVELLTDGRIHSRDSNNIELIWSSEGVLIESTQNYQPSLTSRNTETALHDSQDHISGYFFIGYASLDGKEYADRLYTELKNHQIPVWMSRFNKSPSNGDWREQVIAQSAGMFLVITPQSFKSRSVSQELQIAQRLGKPVLPLLFRGSNLPVPVVDLRYIDFTESQNYDIAIKNVVDWARQTQSGEIHRQVQLLSDLGTQYLQAKDFHQSLGYYEQAMPLVRSIGDRKTEAAILANMGSIYGSLGNMAQALNVYEQALALKQLLGDREGEAAVLANMGGIYSILGRTSQALEIYERALPLKRAIDDREGEAAILTAMGQIGSSRRIIQSFFSTQEIGHLTEVELAQLIERVLVEAGWDDSPFSLDRELRISSDATVDFSLLDTRDKSILTVVEVKRANSEIDHDEANQLKKYADITNVRYAYVTNGYQIIQWDFTRNKKQYLTNFPSANTILELINANKLLQKISRISNPLEKIAGTGLGIITGLNEVFVIDKNIRDQLVSEDPNNQEIIKPLIRGRDLQRWKVNEGTSYVIYAHRNIEIGTYPSIEKYLLKHKDQLEKRPGRSQWWQVHRDSNPFIMDKAKIVVPRIGSAINFAFDARMQVVLDSALYIDSQDFFLLAVLNSRLMQYILRKELAYINQNHYRVDLNVLRELPIVNSPSVQYRHRLSELAEMCIQASDDNVIAGLEQEINELVYLVYQLTHQEIEFIRRS